MKDQVLTGLSHNVYADLKMQCLSQAVQLLCRGAMWTKEGTGNRKCPLLPKQFKQGTLWRGSKYEHVQLSYATIQRKALRNAVPVRAKRVLELSHAVAQEVEQK